jgi:hypothetical protein
VLLVVGAAVATMFLFYGIFFFLMKKFASVVETDIRKKDKKEVERKEK